MKRNVQNTKFQTPNTNKGITLVALVITIIVLLILAGAAINMAIDSEGLFGKANEAVQKWNESVKKESDMIDDILLEIGVVNWEKAMAEAVAPESQDEERNANVIGIGTDGKPVDMDLWEYTLLSDGAYALNSADVLNNKEVGGTNEEPIVKPGYKGDYLDNGSIIGKIPQYISVDKGKNFIEVTNMYATFVSTKLKNMPQIPNTVTFLRSTFARCEELINTTEIPNSVIDMNGTFYNCSSLKVAPNLPNNVENCYATFQGCTSLVTGAKVPSSVLNIRYMFADCPNLQGVLEINANITNEKMEDGFTNYLACLIRTTTVDGIALKVNGNCPMLENIVTEAENPNITL